MVAMNKEGRNLMSAEQDLLPLAKDKTPEEVVTRNKKQLEAKEASECLLQVEEEQRQKEQELEEISAKLQLSKQRTEEACEVAALNQL